MWSVHVTEYYSSLKRKEVPIHTTEWISLENMLSEESQTRRTNIWFHIEEVPKEADSETEETRGHQGLGEVGV